MNTYRLRGIDAALVVLAIGLTLSTAYIHYWVGGLMLMLNSVGYLTLAVVVTASALLYRRALPVLLVALAAYAAVTIVGWLIMGPYFDVAYLAKAIEIVLITTIGIWLARNREWARESINWAIGLPRAVLGSRRRQAPADSTATGNK